MNEHFRKTILGITLCVGLLLTLGVLAFATETGGADGAATQAAGTAGTSTSAVKASGTTGGLTWTLYTDGLLEITGEGAMPEYVYYDRTPWYDYRSIVTTVNIGDGVTSIGRYAFSYCSGLTSITIPGSVTSIGYAAFDGYNSLRYNNDNGGEYLGSDNNPYQVLVKGTATSGIHPDTQIIAGGAFSDCYDLTSITIPEKVTNIGDFAFSNCVDLTSVTIPDSVTSIGTCAFSSTFGLKSITLPGGVTRIGPDAFHGSALTSITLPDSVTSIGAGAFSSCDGLQYNDYNGGKYLGNDNNSHMALIEGTATSGIHPDTRIIADGAFENCSGLISITIPNSVTGIGDSAFRDCSALTSVTIGKDVVSIGANAFVGTENVVVYCDDNPYVTEYCKNNGVMCCRTGEVATRATGTTGGLTWTLYADGLLEITGEGAMPDYKWNTMPWYNYLSLITSVNIGDGVTSIGVGAFESFTSLISITIPDSVTSIGAIAFRGCSSLTSVTFGSGLKDISGQAFYGCSGLTSITIPDSVTSIGEGAFSYCTGLTSITIPDSVTSIGFYAFSDCSRLTTITIPNSVTNIGSGAFSGCSGLTSITVEDGNTTYHSAGNCLIETATKTLVAGCKNSVIPADGSVTSIGSSAFEYCSGLTSITIPDSVTSIGGSAFFGCTGLTSITIPDSVTSIGRYAFSYCSGLTSITIPESVTSIGDYTFHNCSGLTLVTIPDSVTSIDNCAFYDCTLLATITFHGTEEQWAAITKDPTWDIDAGKNTAAGKYTLVFDSGEKASEGLEFTLNDNGKSYSVSGIGSCTDTEIVIPSTYNNLPVTGIGDFAFSNCVDLTSVTIPDSVTSIGERPFYWCFGLTAITVSDGNSKYYSAGNCLIETSTQTLISGCKTSVIPDGVISIGGGAFDYIDLTSVTIPDSVTSIGAIAFQGCSSLTSVTFGSGLKDISGQAFYGCSGLTTITIPDSVTSIGYAVFQDCSDLTSVTFGNGLKNIGDNAFCGCSGLTSIVIPDSVTSIGNGAFDGCGNLQYNYYNGGKYLGNSNNPYKALFTGTATSGIHPKTQIIAGGAFSNRSYLTKITIPAGVTSIGHGAFYGCTGLTSITIPDSVTSIGEWAFGGCTGLTSVTVGKGVAGIGADAFDGAGNVVVYHDGNSYVVEYCESNNLLCCRVGEVIVRRTGTIGTLTWTLYTDGLLEITGEGTMPDYQGNTMPWFNYRSLITSVNIGDGVISIGDYAFYRCSGLTSATIGTGVMSIGDGTFVGANHVVVYSYGNRYVESYCKTNTIEYHDLSFIYGDANGDGEIDSFDIVRLKKYLAAYDYEIQTSSVDVGAGADANGDGVIDALDIVRLQKYLANYDYDTGTSTVLLGPQK